MMMNHGVADGLSDAELAQAVQGNGSIPGYIALSILDQRQKIRAGAPVQAPTQSIAQGIVSKALSQAGLGQPQQPQSGITAQSPQQSPQPGGITAQPQSFAKGGILSLASGGDVNSQYIPQFQTVTPQTVQYNPGYTPDATTLAQSQQQINPLYGQSPDYAGQQDQIQQANTQSQAPLNGVGRTLTNLIGNIASSPGNPYAGWGKGLIANQDQNDKLRQQNFGNTLKTVEQTGKITDDQQRRAQAMASTVESYAAHQQGLADSQAQMRMAADTHNATAFQQAQEANNRNTQASAQDNIELTKNMGDPAFVASALGKAQANGDTKTVAALSPVLANLNKQRQLQEQQSSDITHTARMEELRQQEGAAAALENQREAAEQKRAELQYGSGDPGALKAMVDQITQYRAPLSRFMTSRLPQGQKEQLASAVDAASGGKYSEDTYKAIQNLNNDKSIASSDTAIKHMGMLSDYFKAQDNGNVQLLNKARNALNTEFGGNAASNIEGLKNNVADEISQGYGQNNVSSHDAFSKVFDPKNSPGQISGALDGQIKALAESVESKRNRVLSMAGVPEDHPVIKSTEFPDSKDIIVSRGLDPLHPSRGANYQGLPGGSGNIPSVDVKNQFLKASGGNKKDAARMMQEFGYIW